MTQIDILVLGFSLTFIIAEFFYWIDSYGKKK